MNPYFIYAGNPDKGGKWKIIENNNVAREKAILEGYTAFSTMSFEFPYEKGKPEPNRIGNLWFDFDSKEDPKQAIGCVRYLLGIWEGQYPGFKREMVRYFLSGSKGCHICIPALVYGDETGDPLLPIIHKEMVRWLTGGTGINLLEKPVGFYDFKKFIDMSLYAGGRGHLLREANIKRPDGKYKVEVSSHEFFDMDKGELLELTKTPRNLEIATIPPTKTGMQNLFTLYKKLVYETSRKSKVIPYLFKCKFMRHCFVEQANLSEPMWFKAMCVLANFGEYGLILARMFSEQHPRYDVKETMDKIVRAREYKTSCKDIRESFGICPIDCDINITNLVRNIDKIKPIASYNFVVKDDGLYTVDYDEAMANEKKISSYIKILGKCKNPDNSGWGRLVELKAPDGTMKSEILKMRDCTGKSEEMLKRLADLGVEITSQSSCKLLMDFIRTFEADTIYTQVEQLGWHEENFVLPDKIFGENGSSNVIYKEKDHVFGISGSFEDWQNQIGKYAVGNSLVMFCLQYALTGVLLRPCGIEGGGIHIYGPSSKGKSTIALVIGSVCGGSENKGFIRNWNGSANAFERVASQHNDSILVLDEINQAGADDLWKLAYMLTNGIGKERMNKDTSLRKTLSWMLSYLSTGEETIEKKLQESKKFKAMAGQATRFINLFALADGEIFSNLHGMASPGALSEHLSKVSKKIYGAPLRIFLSALFGISVEDFHNNIKLISGWVDDFLKDNLTGKECGQVRRVARRFGLIAAVGKFACRNGIYLWSEKAAYDVTLKWFLIWLKDRGGIGNLEVEKAIEAVYEYIERYSHSRFYPTKDLSVKKSDNFSGFYWEEKKDKIYFFTNPSFKAIVGGVNYHEVIETMKTNGMIKMTGTGKQMETKSVQGITERGVGVIVSDVVEGKAIRRIDPTWDIDVNNAPF